MTCTATRTTKGVAVRSCCRALKTLAVLGARSFALRPWARPCKAASRAEPSLPRWRGGHGAPWASMERWRVGRTACNDAGGEGSQRAPWRAAQASRRGGGPASCQRRRGQTAWLLGGANRRRRCVSDWTRDAGEWARRGRGPAPPALQTLMEEPARCFAGSMNTVSAKITQRYKASRPSAESEKL